MADVVVINKIDSAAKDLATVTATIESLNPEAKIVTARSYLSSTGRRSAASG